jgi:hypothetical protein
VFEEFPYPMTNAEGEPLHFNGSIKPLAEVRANDEREWFWMMAIAPDSPWREELLRELRATLSDEPGDFVDFDGFEIDSYGDPAGARYYAAGSAYSGRPLSDVLAGLIGEIRAMARGVRPIAPVSFNCVNEFGIDQMIPATDFLFIENWAAHKSSIEDTIDIAFRHRAKARQRVVLKMYPADAGFDDPPYFPVDHLRLMMGLCIAGGGSLMIVGEPNETTGELHALHTLYYPDNVALPTENTAIVRAYNAFDAMLYGYQHGPGVENVVADDAIGWGDVAARAFRNERGDLTVTLLRHDGHARWDAEFERGAPLEDIEIALALPDGMAVRETLFASPDDAEFSVPRPLDFEVIDGHVRLLLPRLDVLGAVVVVAE